MITDDFFYNSIPHEMQNAIDRYIFFSAMDFSKAKIGIVVNGEFVSTAINIGGVNDNLHNTK